MPSSVVPKSCRGLPPCRTPMMMIANVSDEHFLPWKEDSSINHNQINAKLTQFTFCSLFNPHTHKHTHTHSKHITFGGLEVALHYREVCLSLSAVLNEALGMMCTALCNTTLCCICSSGSPSTYTQLNLPHPYLRSTTVLHDTVWGTVYECAEERERERVWMEGCELI